jgi:hypothetical protein
VDGEDAVAISEYTPQDVPADHADDYAYLSV